MAGTFESIGTSTALRTHDYHEDWGLVMAGNGFLEFTKDGRNFEHKSFPGTVSNMDS